MPDDSKPRLDEFIGRVVRDPSQPQETLLLQGFLGASSEPDHTRIYSDVTLESYIDVANADIIHSEPLPKEESPMGGSYVWVKKSAEAFPGVAGADRAKVKFLEGPIAAEAASFSGGAAVGPVAQLPKTVPLLVCHPTILVKFCPPPPTKQFICPPITWQPACQITVAQPICHQSVLLTQCPQQTIFQPQCIPVQSPACPWEVQSVACQPQFPQQPIQQPGQPADFGVQPQAGPAIGGLQFPKTIGGCPSILTICPSVQIWNCPTHSPIFCPPKTVPINCPPKTIFQPQCIPVQTPGCPWQVQSVACQPQVPHGQQPADFGVAAAPPIPPSQIAQQCQSIAVAACPTQIGPICNPSLACPTPKHQCPSVAGFHCPTVQGFQCPSVAGFHCPSVQGFQCPSVAGFHCPSVAGFQCPSVAGFHCPVTHNPQCPPPTDVCTDVGPHCNPTPNPVHCPTPNMICPHPTSHCPSVGEICATSSPLFCPTWFGWPNGPC
jgi:hypothetical protein